MVRPTILCNLVLEIYLLHPITKEYQYVIYHFTQKHYQRALLRKHPHFNICGLRVYNFCSQFQDVFFNNIDMIQVHILVSHYT